MLIFASLWHNLSGTLMHPDNLAWVHVNQEPIPEGPHPLVKPAK